MNFFNKRVVNSMHSRQDQARVGEIVQSNLIRSRHVDGYKSMSCISNSAFQSWAPSVVHSKWYISGKKWHDSRGNLCGAAPFNAHP